jgi:DNA-binding transcriptional regulator YdaS (Cro superfamily)
MEPGMSKGISKAPSENGELRRRCRAWLENGLLSRLGSEGRLVACYAFHWADFRSCTIKIGTRSAARMLGVSPTAVTRGIRQMAAQKALVMVSTTPGGRRLVEIPAVPNDAQPVHEVCTDRTRGVHTPYTRRVRSGYEVCTERTRGVHKVYTPRIPFQLSIGNQFTNGELDIPQAGMSGSGPDSRPEPGRAEVDDARAAPVLSQETKLTEENQNADSRSDS